MKWSESQTVRLVKLYGKTCLWNKSNVNYYNKRLREAEYKNIIKQLNVETLTVPELKMKIHSLRNAYNKLKRKSSNVYKPDILWFNIMDKFMRGSEELRTDSHRSSIENHHIEVGNHDQRAQLNDERSPVTSGNYSSPSASAEAATNPNPAATYIGTDQLKTTRDIKQLDILHCSTNEICEMLNFFRKREEVLSQNGINETFGRYVALILNEMSLTRACLAQNEIQEILSQYIIRNPSVHHQEMPTFINLADIGIDSRNLTS